MTSSASPSSTSRTPTSPDSRFRGCFTAIVTPFTADGKAIDFNKLKEQIAAQAAGGVTGIVVAGTTGESPTLEEHEYKELLTRALELAKPHKLMVIAGTGSNSTAHAIHLHTFAAKAGADASLSVNPYYNKPTQEGMYRHFTAIADSADLPIMLYNIPGRCGVALATETIQRLASHRNIAAVKEATGSIDNASDVAIACPGLALLSGDDPLTLPMASVGAVGVVSVLSNLLPGRVTALCNAFLNNKWDEALTLHRELVPLAKGMFIESNPIPLKTAMKLLGRDSGAVRLPMCPASDATIAKVKQLLAAAQML